MKASIMQIIRDINNLPLNLRGGVLAIGNFDGLHLAHQGLLGAAKQLANASKSPKIVMSFYPHPKHYFVKNAGNFAIEPFSTRLRRLKQLGFDAVLIMRFNDELANMSAHDFITDILQIKLGVKHVVVGDDFRFGKNRLGTPEMLRKYDIGATAFAQMKLQEVVISSTNVRKLLSEGNMEQAASLLGRPYEIAGVVIHGEKRGRELGVRTLNISLHGLHLPAFGVYAVHLWVDDEPHQAIANLGVRPTFGKNEPILEVHNFMPLDNLYGCKVRVQLLHYVRSEMQFDSANALQNQINNDIEKVKEYFAFLGQRV
jgi:riboflavin kinase/FMN adenylyltransferase